MTRVGLAGAVGPVEAMRVPDPFDYDETCAVIGWVNTGGGSAVASEEGEALFLLNGVTPVQIGDWVVVGLRTGRFIRMDDESFTNFVELVA